MTRKVNAEFVEIASHISTTLAAAIAKAGPIRLPRRDDVPLIDVLFRAIAGQQLSTKAARSIWKRMLESADGRPLTEFIAASNTDQIRQCGLSAAKVKSMKAIVAAHDAGRLDEAELRRLPHPERSVRLTAIWGVGPWTADMLGIFYFSDRDVWPDGDLAVGKTLQRLTSRRRKTALTAARFAPRRSYLALYMWRIADTSPG